MNFSKAVWNSTKKSWILDIYNSNEFDYYEIRSISSNDIFFLDPDINTNKFNILLKKISSEVVSKGKQWFASPIKENIFLKRVKHNFEKGSNENNYGTNSLFRWRLYKLVFDSSGYELYWSIFIEDYKEPMETLNTIEDLRENIVEEEIQQLEVEELKELPSQPSNIVFEISSRAIYKKRVREARLKATIATMKAEKMAEKYFRRYGTQINFDDESDLSSEEE